MILKKERQSSQYTDKSTFLLNYVKRRPWKFLNVQVPKSVLLTITKSKSLLTVTLHNSHFNSLLFDIVPSVACFQTFMWFSYCKLCTCCKWFCFRHGRTCKYCGCIWEFSRDIKLCISFYNHPKVNFTIQANFAVPLTTFLDHQS